MEDDAPAPPRLPRSWAGSVFPGGPSSHEGKTGDGAAVPAGPGSTDRSAPTASGDGLGRREFKNHALDRWPAARKNPFEVKVVRRPPESEGFGKLPKRWVAERSFAGLGWDRRHSKDYAWHRSSSEA